MFRRAGVFLLAAVLLATAAAGPATRPSTQPSDIAQWLQATASPEPDRREAALVQLLGLTPDDLPALHDIAKAQSPLKPAQVDALRQTVIYVLTRATMMREPSSGRAVMGVMLSPYDFGGIAQDEQGKPLVGVEVISRLPGFAAARYLRESDLITGFDVDGVVHWFESRQQLQPFVSQLPVGKVVTVLIRRGGQDLRITFPLDAGRASEAVVAGDPARLNLQVIAEDAEKDAVKQLEQQFGDVLGSGVD